MTDTPPEQLEPHWGVIGNVVTERLVGGAVEPWSGTKKFRAGARVYFHSAYWGGAGEQITVVGQHRGSRKLITTVVNYQHLTNWRAKVIYQPAALRRLSDSELHYRFDPSQHDPETFHTELADRLNRHGSGALRAVDRSPEEVDALIDTWTDSTDPELSWVRSFVGDRGMILMQGGNTIGVGKTTAHKGRALWVRPDVHEFRSGEALTALVNRASQLPTIQLPVQLMFAYRTGLPAERYDHIAHNLTRIGDLVDRLAGPFLDESHEEPQMLTEFVGALLDIPELEWPPLEPVALAQSWLNGVQLDEGSWSYRQTIEPLARNGASIVRAALCVIVMSRDLESSVVNKLWLALGAERLRTGTSSIAAHRATQNRYQDVEPIDRVEASRQWDCYTTETNDTDYEGFADYLALGRGQ